MKGPVAWALPGASVAACAKSLVFGERGFGTIPVFCLRVTGPRLGAMVICAWCEPICRSVGIVPVVRNQSTMGDAMVGKGEGEAAQGVIASIMASAMIPASLAQSEVVVDPSGAILDGRGPDWDELGFAGWSQRTVSCQAAKDA